MYRLSCRLSLAALAIAAASPSAWADEHADAEPPRESAVITLDDIVVTGVGRPEPLSKVASTVQLIDSEEIREAHNSSVTESLSERAVAFFSEWTAGQTSITMRGARSDGQGRE